MGITNTAIRSEPPESVTGLLVAAQSGQGDAWNRIYGALYPDLHRIARAQLRRRQHGGLSATSLVSESWLRLSGGEFAVENRRHFIALIARAMRFVLMDEVRRDMAEKRGEGAHALALDERVDGAQSDVLSEMLAIDHALERLSRLDPRLARLVEMRYFADLDEDEIAFALGVTERTLRRDWRKARAFLVTQLGDGVADAAIAP